MNIIEQIKAVPLENDASPVWYSIDDYGICKVADLKALAESHERLLVVAKEVVKRKIDGEYGDPKPELSAAIEQAEKLTAPEAAKL